MYPRLERALQLRSNCSSPQWKPSATWSFLSLKLQISAVQCRKEQNRTDFPDSLKTFYWITYPESQWELIFHPKDKHPDLLRNKWSSLTTLELNCWECFWCVFEVFEDSPCDLLAFSSLAQNSPFTTSCQHTLCYNPVSEHTIQATGTFLVSFYPFRQRRHAVFKTRYVLCRSSIFIFTWAFLGTGVGVTSDFTGGWPCCWSSTLLMSRMPWSLAVQRASGVYLVFSPRLKWIFGRQWSFLGFWGQVCPQIDFMSPWSLSFSSFRGFMFGSGFSGICIVQGHFSV